ncbi:hypothetical protein TraAM80_07798 [Trypanosoma rangeli]|uniref:Uncharacterized protein n=1 Tax=Trypanosoma rangeli TaxID=5698 RepID=A0A3R7N4P2_TRYRA|nr:uncharacterized protein TraAM80_07798 [Trypanosoma rangeli]RNF00115.1 hypothetical protein TraAM80_07798 [Trypanosoma rangeli]|eukprot:RNF00115.1 hypothetical protein TraAM80_07798 [Trypanosoma rangeli]
MVTTTTSTTANSLSAHVYHDNLLLFSGVSTDRLWWLNLPSLRWHEEVCSGVFPPPTRFHATALRGLRLYLSGGEPPSVATLCTAAISLEHDLLEVFVIDLQELHWETVACGWKPRNRSHHTMTAVENSLIVVGGKPLLGDVTANEMRELLASGFYAIHVLDTTTGVWRVFSEARFPPLWGHTVHAVNSSAIVIYGGFEITLETDEAGDELPTIAVNNYVGFLNWKTMEYYQAPTRVPGRVMHQAHLRGNMLCVLGGFLVDEAHLDLVPKRDAIGISLITFEAAPMMFCLQNWSHEQLASVVYNQQLIALNTMNDIFVQRILGDEPWVRYRCDPSTVATVPFPTIFFSRSKPQEDGKEGMSHTVSIPFDGPLSRPSISPLLWKMLSRLEYPLADMC